MTVPRTIHNKTPGVYYGLYRGIVVNNNDVASLKNAGAGLMPTVGYLGKIQVDVPQVYGTKINKNILPWASPCLPFPTGVSVEGPKRIPYGLLAIPRIGSEVWVMFEHGDPRKPVWMGGPLGMKDGRSELGDAVKNDYPDTLCLYDGTDVDGQYLLFKRKKSGATDLGEIQLASSSTGASITLKRSGEIDAITNVGDIRITTSDGVVTVRSGVYDVDETKNTFQQIVIDSKRKTLSISGINIVITGDTITVRAKKSMRLSSQKTARLSAKVVSGFERHNIP